MYAEWSAECSAEDPVLVIPWRDPQGNVAFVDLRANPYDFEAIPEAEQYPPLMQALRALNATRSPVFTAKCDAWPLADEELENLQLNLDLSPSEETTSLSSGFASYIDLVARERSLFTSSHKHEQLLRRLTRLAAPLDYSVSALDGVLRPAFLDLDTPQQGFAFSLYVKALGADPPAAMENWAAALNAVVALIRSKDMMR